MKYGRNECEHEEEKSQTWLTSALDLTRQVESPPATNQTKLTNLTYSLIYGS